MPRATKTKRTRQTRKGELASGNGSPSDTLKRAAQLADAICSLTEQTRKIDDESWKLVSALTRDDRQFPKAVLLGSVLTDIAEITIDGGSSKPIKIRTGADGDYAVYADNYQDGLPGRIIIEIAHPVKKENDVSATAVH